MEHGRLLAELTALIEQDAQAAESILEYLRERDGGVGLMLGMLSRRPGLFVPHVLQGLQIYDTPRAIDPKTAELAAVAASAALMCEHCLDAHMRAARRKGATLEEIFDVLVVAGAIAESSTLAVAFRRFRQMEAKEDDETKGSDL
ncbi:MAG: carboxymuconolactone decarboxylase family protein [Chloroflexi bacterium]|nr:carboxymuconolactone decarboxylase family protein [Chloroflexota bacterium]MBI3176561.1 carboxymuconolactone decarboxylase family protein [Chloroflexota bacterium]